MSDILIQFHALPEEIITLVRQFVVARDLYVTVFFGSPVNVQPVEASQIDQILHTDKIHKLALTCSVPRFTNNVEQFQALNADALYFRIARVVGGALRQSALTARTLNPDTLKIWREMARRLRRMTTAGVTAIDPNTGASARYKDFRYTEGAKTIADTGVTMLPVAGGTRIVFS